MPLLHPDHADPAILANLPESIGQLLAYWQSKRRGRAMPSRADIEPAEIKTFLPLSILVDVTYDERGEPDFTYRLVGTREVEIRGSDPTGRRVAEAYHGPSVENVIGCYRLVVDNRVPFLDDEYFVRDGDNFADEANLFLPLSNDGERVNMVMVFTAYRRLR
ncbi:MAG: PAS domain-containing protein [Hyphomicrobiaceae bacterium]|nr:PAS domain-containing protein [Hyphomicrobiaceae bacterium]